MFVVRLSNTFEPLVCLRQQVVLFCLSSQSLGLVRQLLQGKMQSAPPIRPVTRPAPQTARGCRRSSGIPFCSLCTGSHRFSSVAALHRTVGRRRGGYRCSSSCAESPCARVGLVVAALWRGSLAIVTLPTGSAARGSSHLGPAVGQRSRCCILLNSDCPLASRGCECDKSDKPPVVRTNPSPGLSAASCGQGVHLAQVRKRLLRSLQRCVRKTRA